MFKRKKADDEPEPVRFGAEDLPALEAIIDNLLASVGGPGIDGAVLRLSARGGFHPDHPESVLQYGPRAADRPWQWLQAGVAVADAEERPALVVKACAFVGFWQMQIAPKLTPANWLDTGLGGCPADVEEDIHRRGLRCAQGFDPSAAVAQDARGDVMPMSYVMRAAELRLDALGAA